MFDSAPVLTLHGNYGNTKILRKNVIGIRKNAFEPTHAFHRKCVIVDSEVSERYENNRPIDFNSTKGGSRQMLRSIKKAFDIIKAEDIETAITVHTIRTWCKQGKIKCLTAGNKILVDMQSLLDYIAIKKDNTEV